MQRLQPINVGQQANDRSGDPLRDGMVKVNENFAKVEAAVDKVEATAAGAQQRPMRRTTRQSGPTRPPRRRTERRWQRRVGSRWPGRCGGGRRQGRRGPGRGRRSRQEGGRRQCGGARRRSPPLPAASEADRKALAANAPPWSRTARLSRPRKPPPWPRPPADEADKRRKRRFPFPTQAYSPAWPRWKAALRRWPMRRFRTSRRLPYGTMPTGTNCPSVLAMMDSSCA